MALGHQGREDVNGTRNPTRHGEVIARRVTEFLVRERVCVVSGLAVGCDSIAHETCVALGGATIAVLAHGLHTVAPATNSRLADAIVDSGGALVTQYPFGAAPRPHQYLTSTPRLKPGDSPSGRAMSGPGQR